MQKLEKSPNQLVVLSVLLLLAITCARSVAEGGEQTQFPYLQTANTEDILNSLELKVFGMKNPEQPVATRLELLENKTFGAEQEGSLIQRLTHLSEQIEHLQPAEQPIKPIQKTLMKGAVREYDLAQFGIDTTETTLPGGGKTTRVKAIAPMSPAANWGIEAGDKIESVRTSSQSTVITISRDGKIYSADLSAQRKTTFSQPAEPIQMTPTREVVATQPAPAHVLKHFVGVLSTGITDTQELTSDVTTDFDVTPNGIYSGRYHQTGYDGVLSEGKALSPRESYFRWQDIHGDGTLIVTFNDDMTAFKGYWTFWHLTAGMSKSPDPYLDPVAIKSNGLRWVGRTPN